MGPPAVPPMQRSSSQLDYKRVMPGMSPRQKSCDDMKRHTIRAQVREGRSRYAQRSATSQRKCDTSFSFVSYIFLCSLDGFFILCVILNS